MMKPGDIIAFGGDCLLSKFFQWVTRSCVSHVGVILQSKPVGTSFLNLIIESTDHNGVFGVQINRLRTIIEDYKGKVWWLPLGTEIRNKLDLKKFQKFLIGQDGKPFDIEDAAELMADSLIGRPPDIKGDFRKFFCSELVVAGLEAGGGLPPINCSDITPGDLCRCHLFSGEYYQLKGKKQEIRQYNALNPVVFN